MKPNLDWQDEYLIEVEEIDAQHKRFLFLMKKTYELAGHSPDRQKVDKLLAELLKYAHFHFTSEELLMATYGYPKTAEHKKEHTKITEELNQKIKAIKNNKDDLVNLLMYLSKWFIGHDGYFDKEFGEFVNKHRAIP